MDVLYYLEVRDPKQNIHGFPIKFNDMQLIFGVTNFDIISKKYPQLLRRPSLPVWKSETFVKGMST